jgi:hypothetical protein
LNVDELITAGAYGFYEAVGKHAHIAGSGNRPVYAHKQEVLTEILESLLLQQKVASELSVVCDDFIRSHGHEEETYQDYENRLGAANYRVDILQRLINVIGNENEKLGKTPLIKANKW